MSGRVTIGLSGAEARNQSPTNDRPYKETMSYDALGHLTLRDVYQWDHHNSTGTETYTNNRRYGWQYDADGRLTSSSAGYTYYDAAGEVTSFGDWDPYKTDQGFDGDGSRAKTVLQSLDGNTNQWTIEKVTYYVSSSVLGGAVISEVGAQGGNERSFVLAGGTILATQEGGQYVSWEHYDASGTSYRPTDASGALGLGGEMDPFGADAGQFKPLTWPPPSSPGKLEPYYGIPDLNSGTQGCVVDNVPTPCEVLTSENSAQCPDNNCGPRMLERYNTTTGDRLKDVLSQPFQAFSDGYSGYLPRGATYAGNGVVSMPSFYETGDYRLEKNHASSFPQKPPQVGGTNNKGKIKDFNNAFNEAVSRLDSEVCAKLFGGKDAALKALNGARYSYQDLDQATKDPNTEAVSAVGAATNSAANPPSVYINNYGPFRNTTVLVRTSSGVESHTFDFGTKLRGAQFGALLLLHELGHLVGIFGPDTKNPELNRSYTQQVQDACFPKKK